VTRKNSSREAVEIARDVLRRVDVRNPALVRQKWERMSESPFHFFRGSTATFYEWWNSKSRPFSIGPATWVCGDAHWENVGCYRGKNKVCYFDLTDFDEACLAPIGVELARALAALYMSRTAHLSHFFLSAYRETLATGKPQHIEAEVAKGMIAELLSKRTHRKRKKFIAAWTDDNRIRILDGKTYALSRDERSHAARIFRAWAAKRKHSDFFRLLDICGSLSGIGTLGLRRYLVLVDGGERPHLIDMKEAAPSGLAAIQPRLQPMWSCEAERVATIQNYTQYVPIAHLDWTAYRDLSFVLSDFQPDEDRIDSLALPERQHESFTCKWGRLLAWSHLRTASWRRACTVDELMTFATEFNIMKQDALLGSVRRISRSFEEAYREFLRMVADKATSRDLGASN